MDQVLTLLVDQILPNFGSMFLDRCMGNDITAPNQTITENKIPIFEPDFPLDLGQFDQANFTDCLMYLTVTGRSAQKLPHFAMESLVTECLGLT